jgi:acyl-CoA reductase-like NAD-dependent aldehyde dehydrogenase
VRCTAIDALARGFTVRIADDAIGSNDPLHAGITRRYLAQRGVAFIPSREILAPTPPARFFSPRLAAAVDGAQAAAEEWCRRPLGERRALLENLSPIIESQADALASALVESIEKPVRFAKGEIRRCLDLVAAVTTRSGDALDRPAGEDASCRFQPHGVVAIITPWNHPLAIPLGKILPALLFGNAVAWKPSPETADLPEKLMDLFDRARLPTGLVSLVTGEDRIGEELMGHPKIDAVSLTAGRAAGWSAQAICATRSIPLQAELGGNNSVIVWDAADLDDAAAKIAFGAFGFAGQRCTATRRAIVSERIYSSFLERLIDATRALAWGDPHDFDTVIGPVISDAAAARLEALVSRAADSGASVTVPHNEARPSNRHIPPTIIEGASPDSEIVQNESFGPILVLQRESTFEAALTRSNGVREGLVASLFSSDETLHNEFLDTAEAGVLKLNASTADVGVDAPFGGWKNSGLGPPEHGFANREFYTRIQTIYTS